jgi:hypothetical protein
MIVLFVKLGIVPVFTVFESFISRLDSGSGIFWPLSAYTIVKKGEKKITAFV